MRFRIVLLSPLLVLSACGSGSPDVASGDPALQGAKNGVAATAALASENLLNQAFTRPSPVLGVYVASFLSGTATAQAKSALDGVAAQIQLYLGQQATGESTSATVEQLGTTLQVDVPDMLNRSTDRTKALDEYVDFLRGAMTEAQATKDNLTMQGKELDAQLSTQRSAVSTLKREVDKAVKNKDFALAGGKQQLLNDAQAKLSELENKRSQVKDSQGLLVDLLAIGAEREQAITQNRDVLIAGLTVINVPGIDDLGILKQGSRSKKRTTGGFGDL